MAILIPLATIPSSAVLLPATLVLLAFVCNMNCPNLSHFLTSFTDPASKSAAICRAGDSRALGNKLDRHPSPASLVSRQKSKVCALATSEIWYGMPFPLWDCFLGLSQLTGLHVVCPLVRLSPGEVAVSDISAVREIHRVGGKYMKSPWYQTLTPKGVQNLFNTNDPQFHSRHRRLLSMPMSDSSLRVVEPLVDSRIQLTIHRMKDDMERAGVVNIHKWWILMTSDIIGELSFGESLGLLETGKESQFITDLKAIGMMEGLNTTFPSLVKLASICPLPFIPNVVTGGRRMVQYANDAIARYKKQLVTNAENPKLSLFTRLYNATADGLTDAEIRDEAISYIIAGSDTTATSLTYLVWAVCRNPSIKHALLEEVNSLPAGFNDQDTRQLPLLGQVINETLRLYAAAPSALPRVVPSGGRTLAGHFVPEGITISSQAYSLHRDPTIFPDPTRQDRILNRVNCIP